MFKRTFNLLLAVLMVLTVVFGSMAGTVEAADEEKEYKWTLVEFTWDQLQYNKSIAEEKAYALVGGGNGEDVFTKLASDELHYAERFDAVVEEMKKEANAEKQSDGISFVQIKGKPDAFTFKTAAENQTSGTVISFNGQEVAKVAGDSAFIIATWSLDNYKAEPAADDAALYLYHSEGCMNGEGVKRQLCNGCGLITVHGMLSFCGHSSCVEANHEPAACGYDGHKACYDRHGAARCGLKGHYVCTGKHDDAPCKTAKHFVCDGKTHTACPGCGKLQCAKDFKAAEHVKAACGKHYICASGYAAANHAAMACGHFTCSNDGKEHAVAVCGIHYKCATGYVEANHTGKAACGVHPVCAGGDHGMAACNVHAICAGGTHTACGTCGAFLCTGDHGTAACGVHKVCEGGTHSKCDVTGCDRYVCDTHTH